MVVLHYIRWSSYAEICDESFDEGYEDKWREVSQLYAISIRFCDHQKIIILYMYAVDQCMVHVNYKLEQTSVVTSTTSMCVYCCLLYTSDAADE